MFLTFSKGYPVAEHEVRNFFTRLLGNCIESVYMQEVGPLEQSLFAKVVFLNPSFMDMILKGAPKVKFSINVPVMIQTCAGCNQIQSAFGNTWLIGCSFLVDGVVDCRMWLSCNHRFSFGISIMVYVTA